MDVMRYTIVDDGGAVSFLTTPAVLPALVAACASDPATVDEFLSAADQYGALIGDYVRSGLAIFDEHNVPGRFAVIHEALDYCPQGEVPVFRVVDDRTREASLQPVKAGVVLFNLVGKRIVQIQNTAVRIDRSGRFRIHDAHRGRTRVFRYRLPSSWHIVP